VAAIDHCRDEADTTWPTDSSNAVERAVVHIGRHPHHASQRFSHKLGIPELRAWPIARFRT
jgi:hypothetical protein